MPQTNIQKEKTRYDMRGILVLIVSAISGWGVYSFVIEIGMQPRAIWFFVASGITFLWLNGLNYSLCLNKQ